MATSTCTKLECYEGRCKVRGTARYLGYIYNNAEAGLANSRFVSGKFVWDYDGHKLVKDVRQALLKHS